MGTKGNLCGDLHMTMDEHQKLTQIKFIFMSYGIESIKSSNAFSSALGI